MKKMINRTHIEGLLYQHSLELKTSGDNSKNPGTKFITGTVEIATDNAMLNIVPVHFTYVTAVTSNGKENASFITLSNIINGVIGSVMGHGADRAGLLRIDSAIGLNEFYSDRNGKEELVSAKRNEGGFIHLANAIDEDENVRNTFECDMLITGTSHVEADEERNLPEKANVKGYIFNFRNDIMPVEFSVLNPRAISYFEGLEATQKDPVFTRVKGRQVSQTIVNRIEEESAFGEPSVRETKSTRKDFVITWAMSEPYAWDEIDVLTANEVTTALANRETMLATIRQRQEEYKASKNQPAAAPVATGFNF